MHKAVFRALRQARPTILDLQSACHFLKLVAGAQSRGPVVFDPAQQGAGIVDVTTISRPVSGSLSRRRVEPADAQVLSNGRWLGHYPEHSRA